MNNLQDFNLNAKERNGVDNQNGEYSIIEISLDLLTASAGITEISDHGVGATTGSERCTQDM